MAVSAVPGSGKTLVLALLAAKLIIDGHIGDEGEVLVVTVQNSAVDNIAQRIRRILVGQKLPPVGYHVCTLHKLASDILRMRYDLAGVEDGFTIVDDTEAERTMHSAVEALIREQGAWWHSFLPEAAEGRQADIEARWREETGRVGREVTRLCKHLRLAPQAAQVLLERGPAPSEFLGMGIYLYTQYSKYLQAHCGLDFDDLIWRALDALEQDEDFLRNLRVRWPFILEDEAQDSSPLQEQILEKLRGDHGNWVRVGDPNQAINSTFTAADPRYFRRFMQRQDVIRLGLAESGRCGLPIISLANHLVHWASEEHPQPEVREMAFLAQDIQPVGPGDPQPNPPAEECHVHIAAAPYNELPTELDAVSRSAVGYVRRYPERAVAILCPTQAVGAKAVEVVRQIAPAVPVDDLLRSTPQARDVARLLAAGCAYLADPMSRHILARLFGVLAEGDCLGPANADKRVRQQRALVGSLAPHALLFPRDAADVREILPPGVDVKDEDTAALSRFAIMVSRWVRAASLPVDQLLLTLGQDLFRSDVDLAICHTIATSLRAAAEMHLVWRLPDYADELEQIARNRRGLVGLSPADAGYVARKGHIAVTTMHKAKGLEWDAVYLVSVDGLEFPSATSDAFRDEPFFMPGRAPAVEARKCLEQLAGANTGPLVAQGAVEQARLEYIAERLRLLYVGVTRARRDLSLTWSENRGRRRVPPAAALVKLRELYRTGHMESTL
jgi:DNA helicase-2/ATP-dependent DNA helicase PcrA